MRFWNTQSREDVIVCNNEKLVLNSTGPYVEKAESFLRDYVFADGSHWPDVILGASWLASWKDATNFGVEVCGCVTYRGRALRGPAPRAALSFAWRPVCALRLE